MIKTASPITSDLMRYEIIHMQPVFFDRLTGSVKATCETFTVSSQCNLSPALCTRTSE